MKKRDYSHRIGAKEGMLTVLSYHRVNGIIKFVCLCDCGKEKTIDAANFNRKKHVISCGCNKGKRGLDYDCKHPLYDIWQGVKGRCYNERDNAYHNYGGRGVVMCEEWRLSYKAFFDWAISNGWRKGLFIDKDVKGNSMIYSPETCSIVTRAENNRSRRMVKLNWDAVEDILSSTTTVKELAKKYNCSISSIYSVKYKKTWQK